MVLERSNDIGPQVSFLLKISRIIYTSLTLTVLTMTGQPDKSPSAGIRNKTKLIVGIDYGITYSGKSGISHIVTLSNQGLTLA